MQQTLFIYFYICSIIVGITTPLQVVVLPTTERTTLKVEEDMRIIDADVIQLNVGGRLLMTTRSTLTRVNGSILAMMFNGRWEDQLNRDRQGNIFLDFDPVLFEHLLEQLRFVENEEFIQFYPPSTASLVTPFGKMLRKLKMIQAQTSKDVLELNIGGAILTTRQKIVDKLSNLTNNLFIDSDPKIICRLINQLRGENEIDLIPMTTEDNELLNDTVSSSQPTVIVTLPTTTSTTTPLPIDYNDGICAGAIWNPNGTTVAGGNGRGSGLNQLDHPMGLFMDDYSSIYIADTYNHRIIKWLPGATHGEIILHYNGSKNYASKVVVHRNGTVYFCDRFHNRIVQWFNHTEETIVSNISCWGLVLDREGSLYISVQEDHRIVKWPGQEIVVGENGGGSDNDQLSSPYQIFLDGNQTIYIADYFNHRIMKWFNNLQEGLVVVAGGNGYGDGIDQLKLPHAVVVDQMGTMYIVDFGNGRIMRWFKHSKSGTIIIGNDGSGNRTNQLSDPYDIAFDRQGNLYVADTTNHRIQMYQIDKSACATTLDSNE